LVDGTISTFKGGASTALPVGRLVKGVLVVAEGERGALGELTTATDAEDVDELVDDFSESLASFCGAGF
jgi:hypothetical protein